MFGAPDKDKIKKAFSSLDDALNQLPATQDPHIRAILEFIARLQAAF